MKRPLPRVVVLCLALAAATVAPSEPSGGSAGADPAAWGWTGIRVISDTTPFGARIKCHHRPDLPVLQVYELEPESPAARAGLQPKDYISRWQDQPVPDVTAARKSLLSLAPAAHLKLTVVRSTGEVPIEIQAEPRSGRPLVLGRAETAAAWLASKQTEAGAWTYSSQGLPPVESVPVSALAFCALATFPGPAQDPRNAAAIATALERGAKYLWAHQAPDGGIDQAGAVRYRVLTTSFTLLAFLALDPKKDPDRLRALRDFLIKEQVTEGRDVPPGHHAAGGWNYKDVFRLEEFKVDITVTAYALDALTAARALPSPDLPACCKRAEAFLARCQNLPAPGAPPDPKWDDGGFFTNARTSKAGEEEIKLDVIRFRSYGSATADGLRSLLYAGIPRDDPRVVRSSQWLSAHYDLEKNSGFPPEAPVAYDQAIYYYYLLSLAKALDAAQVAQVAGVAGEPPDRTHDWAREISVALLARQRPAGQWVNANPLMSEDEPAIATGFALLTLNLTQKRIP